MPQAQAVIIRTDNLEHLHLLNPAHPIGMNGLLLASDGWKITYNTPGRVEISYEGFRMVFPPSSVVVIFRDWPPPV